MVTHMKTTIELPDPLLERAKRLAARDSTTLRELIEAGLRHVLKERAARATPFVLRDARVDGRGLNEEFAGASWDDIRNASYEGRGA
jgi:predicted DNA-binding protein